MAASKNKIYNPQESKRPVIPNVLAERYASTPICRLWSPESRVFFEHDLWITVMECQKNLGLDIPERAIASYKAVKNHIDLEAIRKREYALRHDEKARLEDFNERAGYEYAHLGMTSRDQSDNVEQMQIKRGMEIIRDRAVSTLTRFAHLAVEHETLVMAARTHNIPAQPTLLGKLFADRGEELLIGFDRLETLIDKYPLRGLKGAIGTQTDQLQLLKDPGKVKVLEKKVAESLGFKNIMNSVGQIYPRSLDFEVTSTLLQLVSGPANLAKTMRLMTGNEQFTEGFKEGQVGSSSMPHKMNARSCERINALTKVLKGFHTMTGEMIGDQWYDGDVSDSSIRRVALENSFYATDGIFQTMLTVLDECGFYPAVIQQELNRYLPFLTTTRILMTAVENGVGRETAHKVIKEHAVKVALQIREKGIRKNGLLDRLANDKRLGLTKKQLGKTLANPIEFVGTAPQQIAKFAAKVEKIIQKYPEASTYNPEPIL